eukprot:TRINITY_DN77_c3_g1_i1.p1 TRINITY_DN77_c3_g1~~TRINITY_DN77_c3_g1_i1.p1  ORF type:complete len:1349 (-),score=219.94 TRINITY_DN77_c3_g1_i1:2371-6417(-)
MTDVYMNYTQALIIIVQIQMATAEASKAPEEEKKIVPRGPRFDLKVVYFYPLFTIDSHGFGAGFTTDLKESIHFLGDQDLHLLFPVGTFFSRLCLLGRHIGVREITNETGTKAGMRCEPIDHQLEKITAMAMSGNRQCMAVACKFRNDRSAYIFFYDMLQLHPLKRTGKAIHEGSPTDEEDKAFISIAFSPEAKYLAVLTNIKDGNARIYEWKKEARVIATNSWLSELNKEAKTSVNAEITKISIDPNNKDQVCLTGKYHMRIWRNQSNILKPLPPIIGLDYSKVFVDHTWIEGNWLVAGTDKGELCFIYDTKQCVMEMPAFDNKIDCISCLYSIPKGFFVGGSSGQLSFWEVRETSAKSAEDESLKESIRFDRNIRIETRGKIVAMSVNSRTKPEKLAIAYQSNFICLLKLADIFNNRSMNNKRKGEAENVELLYIDEGYHSGRMLDKDADLLKAHSVIMDMDIAVHRPLLITCCKHDSTLRLWNYITRECELVKCLTLQHTSGPPEPVRPLSIAFHPSGYMVAGGFESQAIIWHLLLDELKDYFVFTHYRHCTKLRFSHGGQYLAIAQMVPTQKFVYIHHIYNLEKVATIKIPGTALVCDIVFSSDDSYVAVCCTEGCLIVYDLINKVETMNHSKYKNIYTTCRLNSKEDAIAFGADEVRRGVIRRISNDEIVETMNADEDKINCGEFFTQEYFFAGTESGLVKLFDYPFGTKAYSTLNMHAGPVARLKVSPNGKYAFSCGEDGVVFVYSVSTKMDPKAVYEEKKDELALVTSEGLAQVVLMSKKSIDKERRQIRHLNEKVKDLESNMLIKEKSITDMWHENVRELEAEKRRALAELEGRLNTIKEELSKKEQQYTEAMKKMEANHMAAVADLEAIFKAKLDRERKNYLNLEQNMKETVRDLREELERKEREKERELMEEHTKYEKDLERLNKKIKEVKETQVSAEKRYEEKLTLQEEEHDVEMDKREIDLNKEINQLNDTIKQKEDKINRLDTEVKNLREKNQDMQLEVQNMHVQEEELRGQIARLQNELEKAQKDKDTTIDEMHDLKASVLKLKSKHKEGAKDKQVLSDLAKGLKDKVAPLMAENTELKKSVKGIEEEYYEYLKLLEKQKKTIEHQLAIIAQQKEQLEDRDKKIKEKDAKLHKISQIIYDFREKTIAEKQDYINLVKSLYENFVIGNEEKLRKDPEVADEFQKQLKYLNESKASLERQSKQKEQHLDKICKSLRGENSKLINDLNKALSDLQNAKNTIHNLKREGMGSHVKRERPEKNERSGLSLSMKISHTRDHERSSLPPLTDRIERVSSVREILPLTSKASTSSMNYTIQYRYKRKGVQRTDSKMEPSTTL